MKRKGNLIQEIASFDNLLLAYYKAKKGKEQKPEIIEYAKNINENLKLLKSQIETGDISVGNYHYFTIYDPKERLICAASFSERVLHHAIMNVCHCYFEKYLIFDTYATRLNKGTYKALDRAKIFQKRFQWFLKFDIRKYFDSIRHNILKEMLNNKFKDEKLLFIFQKILNSYHTEQHKGLPIGNLTSQYFANHYLGKLDHFVKHVLKIKGYVRYMDDFVVWHNDKKEILNAKKQIKEFIINELDLQIKTCAMNRSSQGLTFLGYRVFPDKIVLAKRSKSRYAKKMAEYTKLLKCGIWSQDEFAHHVSALTAFTEYAYSKSFRKKVLLNNGQ